MAWWSSSPSARGAVEKSGRSWSVRMFRSKRIKTFVPRSPFLVVATWGLRGKKSRGRGRIDCPWWPLELVVALMRTAVTSPCLGRRRRRRPWRRLPDHRGRCCESASGSRRVRTGAECRWVCLARGCPSRSCCRGTSPARAGCCRGRRRGRSSPRARPRLWCSPSRERSGRRCP